MDISIPTVIIVTIIALLGIGFYGLLVTRNLIKVIVALQLLVKSIMLAFVFAGQMTENAGLGQSMALTVIVADTIVAVVGMALAVQVRKNFGTLDLKALTTLRR
jgi:NADH:ubiquinone oxidoreductase subunit K